MRLLFLMILMISHSVKAQKIPIIAKVINDTVKLRWTPLDIKMYMEALDKGFLIKRFDTSGKLLGTELIKPASPDDSLWKGLIRSEKNSLAAWQLLKSLNKKETGAFAGTLFDLGLMQANFSPATASMMGLSFYEKYSPEVHYSVCVSGIPGTESILDTNLIRKGSFPCVDSLTGRNVKKKNMLSWRNMAYPGYILERSSDGILFEAVNERPIVSLFREEPDTWVYFEDSSAIVQALYYRVYGVDWFGVRTLCSDTVRINLCAPLDRPPSGIKFSVLEKNYLVIRCGDKDTNSCGSKIFRSSRSAGPFICLTPLLLKNTENVFIDTGLYFSAYYLWAIYNNCGDSLLSWPEYYFVPDTIPPSSPGNLKAVADSAGSIHISWQSSGSGDLMGYRVFKTSSLSEEFVEVTEEMSKDTSRILRSPLNSLTHKVYYRVHAVDSNFNVSRNPEIVLVVLPDTIGPVPSVLTGAESKPGGVVLTWIGGNSEDVICRFICRKGINKTDTLFEVLSSDTLQSYTDTGFAQGFPAGYFIVDRDSSGNTSLSNYLEVFHETGYRGSPPAPDIRKVAGNKIIITIPGVKEQEFFSIELYKGVDGAGPALWKTFHSSSEINDVEVSISARYTYAYRIQFSSGVKTLLSKSVSIQF